MCLLKVKKIDMNKLTTKLISYNNRLILNNRKKVCNSAFYSTKLAIDKDENENLHDKIKETERVIHLHRKQRIKKPQKPPFAKNLFAGQFDVDILTYPQLEKDELETLESSLKPVEDFFKNKDTAEFKTFSKEFTKYLSSLSLFGLKVPVSTGGRELPYTDACKFQEILSSHELGRNLICNEDLGIQAILKNGNESLKTKYLPALVSGELLSALCVTERESFDPKSVKTKAVKNVDGSWVC